MNDKLIACYTLINDALTDMNINEDKIVLHETTVVDYNVSKKELRSHNMKKCYEL